MRNFPAGLTPSMTMTFSCVGAYPTWLRRIFCLHTHRYGYQGDGKNVLSHIFGYLVISVSLERKSASLLTYPDLQLMALRWVDGVTLEDTWATRTIAKTHDGTIDAKIRLCLAIAGAGTLVDEFVVVRLAG